jgi:hypothetical protein
MDAIGSGDYEFTNELLCFASTIRGKEISISDFHTLANICELNMGDSDKMPWGILGRAFARTAGRRAFAKIARWNDRGKATFDYSLLPFLKALSYGWLVIQRFWFLCSEQAPTNPVRYELTVLFEGPVLIASTIEESACKITDGVQIGISNLLEIPFLKGRTAMRWQREKPESQSNSTCRRPQAGCLP